MKCIKILWKKIFGKQYLSYTIEIEETRILNKRSVTVGKEK